MRMTTISLLAFLHAAQQVSLSTIGSCTRALAAGQKALTLCKGIFAAGRSRGEDPGSARFDIAKLAADIAATL